VVLTRKIITYPLVGDLVFRNDIPPEVLNKIPPRQGIPPPRYGITKNVFLHIIGRGVDKHADKFADWNELMAADQSIMESKEIPIQHSRHMLRWIHKYKQGIEPQHKRLTSIAKKHKEARKESRDRHAAILRRVTEGREAQKKARREILEANPLKRD